MTRLIICLLLAGCAPALPAPGPLVVEIYDPVYIPSPKSSRVKVEDEKGNTYEGEIVAD